MTHGKKSRAKAGVTLIELLVVLLILTALAGVLIPLLPNFLGKTHGSVGAQVLSEVNNNVQLYQTNNLTYPDNWDSLVDGDGNISDLVMGSAANGMSALDLTDGSAKATRVLAALTSAGITTVSPMTNQANLAGESATSNPYSGVAEALGTATIAELTDVTRVFGYPNLDGVNNYYVALGLGSRSTAIGETISQPPVLVPAAAAMNPQQRYARPIVVFEIAQTGNAPAKFIGACMAMMPGGSMANAGLFSSGEHIDRFYEDLNN